MFDPSHSYADIRPVFRPDPIFGATFALEIDVIFRGEQCPAGMRAAIYFNAAQYIGTMVLEAMRDIAGLVAPMVQAHYEPFYLPNGSFGPIEKEKDDTFRKQMLAVLGERFPKWQPCLFIDMGPLKKEQMH